MSGPMPPPSLLNLWHTTQLVAVNIALPRAKSRPVSLAGISAVASRSVYERPGPCGVTALAANVGAGGLERLSSAARSPRSETFSRASVRMLLMKPVKLAPPFQGRVRENHAKYSVRSLGVQPTVALRSA